MPTFTVQLKRMFCVAVEADTSEEAVERALADDEIPWDRAQSEVEGVEQTGD